MKTPLVFNPVYRDNVWGGERIAALYHRENTPKPCAESWEISGHPAGPGVVASGQYAGRTLADLAEEFGADLVGTACPEPKKFPLLFKIIDANDFLSVQVHPDNKSAKTIGGEPKTEMWYVLGAQPGAHIYAGLDGDANPDNFRKAVDQGRAQALLNRYQVAAGDAFYIPGGLVHAIGPGCLIYEIQQSSDTTYRIYDWNRRNLDGSPARELHLEKGLATIDWSLPAPKPRHTGVGLVSDASVVTCRFFCLKKLLLREERNVAMDGRSFHALFVEKGGATVRCGCECVRLAAGSSCLVPASAGAYALKPEGASAVVLRTTLVPTNP